MPENRTPPKPRRQRSDSRSSQVVACRLPDAEFARLYAVAADRGLTVSSLIRQQVAPLLADAA
jgi:predicted DNA-binding ribbon-helix-helix protein